MAITFKNARRGIAALLFVCFFMALSAPPSVAAIAHKEPFINILKDKPILVFGHNNPDTDTTVGAIALAHLLNAIGRPAVAMAPFEGDLNDATIEVLKRFKLPTPERLGPVAGRQVAVVDFQQLTQAPPDMKEADVVMMVDHRRQPQADTLVGRPYEVWTQLIGSANTVIYHMYQSYGVPIPQNIAQGMISAIVLDTQLLSSVRTSARDVAAVKALNEIAKLPDPIALGKELYTIKSGIGIKPIREVVLDDWKDFDHSNTKFGVTQIFVVDMSLFAKHKSEIFEQLRLLKTERGLHSAFLMFTDVLTQETQFLVVSDDPSWPAKAFNKEIKDDIITLPGVMSRSRQVIPPLEGALKK